MFTPIFSLITDFGGKGLIIRNVFCPEIFCLKKAQLKNGNLFCYKNNRYITKTSFSIHTWFFTSYKISRKLF